MIRWVILALALGDLVILALLLKERRAHAKSRRALKFWRDRSGLKEVPLDPDGSLSAHLNELRSRQPQRDRIRLAQPGGAA